MAIFKMRAHNLKYLKNTCLLSASQKSAYFERKPQVWHTEDLYNSFTFTLLKERIRCDLIRLENWFLCPGIFSNEYFPQSRLQLKPGALDKIVPAIFFYLNEEKEDHNKYTFAETAVWEIACTIQCLQFIFPCINMLHGFE